MHIRCDVRPVTTPYFCDRPTTPHAMPLRVLSQMPTPCVYRLVLRTPYLYLHAAREAAHAEILRDILRWRLRFLIVQFGLIYPPGPLLVRDSVYYGVSVLRTGPLIASLAGRCSPGYSRHRMKGLPTPLCLQFRGRGYSVQQAAREKM